MSQYISFSQYVTNAMLRNNAQEMHWLIKVYGTERVEQVYEQHQNNKKVIPKHWLEKLEEKKDT
jgi:hypothetical protein